MSSSTGTSAENFWDEGFEEETECERFLQKQKTKTVEDEENEVDAEYEEDEDVDDEEETDDDESATEEISAEEETADDDETDESDSEEEDPVEENDPVAEDENDADATQPVKEEKMVKARTKTGGKTKAEAIREVIERRKRAGASLRPRDIIEELSDNGFEVNASQVSVTLRSMGVPPAPKGRVKGTKMKPKEPTATTEPKSRMALKRGVGEKAAAHDGELLETEAMLDKAAEFVTASGGYEKAVAILGMYNRIVSRG